MLDGRGDDILQMVTQKDLTKQLATMYVPVATCIILCGLLVQISDNYIFFLFFFPLQKCTVVAIDGDQSTEIRCRSYMWPIQLVTSLLSLSTSSRLLYKDR